jgi:hypothetical protein
MPTKDNQLKRLQDVIVERLKDSPDLSHLPIFAETKGDLASELEIGLAKLGIVMVVQAVTAGITNPALRLPVFDKVTFTVEIWEDVLLNRSVAALDAAVAVIEQLYHFRLSAVESFGGRVINPAADTMVAFSLDGKNGYYVNFTIG